ncbi:MAG: winged helix-turn-helix domain-containing protein [Candidatus Undinarchaeales archaeon]
MDLLKAIGLKKKKKKKKSKKKKKTSTKSKKKSKSKSKKESKQKKQVEDPVMTVSRQLTNIRRDLQDMDSVVRNGFQGLRADHHRILEEQFDKEDLEEFKKWTEKRKLTLKQIKGKVEDELEMIEIDRKVLDLIEKEKKRSAEIAEELEISRQYASERLNELIDQKLVKRVKKGRKVYYKAS